MTPNASNDDWPMFRHDPAHDGFTNSSAPISKPIVAWNIDKREIGDQLFSSIVVNDIVYAAGANLYAINDTTGKIIWKTVNAGSSIIYANGIIYSGNGGSAFDGCTGKKLWNITNGVTNIALVTEGYFFTLNNDGFLVAVNALTGMSIWTSHTRVYSTPAFANGSLYCGTSGGVIALNAYTGVELWRYNLTKPVSSSPAVFSGYVYVGGLDGNVYCFDAIKGIKVWNYTTGEAVSSSPAVAYGYAYVGSLDGKVYAFNASTGENVWNCSTYFSKEFSQGISSSPAVANNAVYIGSDDGNLYAIDAFTGAKLWNFTLQTKFDKFGNPQFLSASPSISNGRIYLASEEQFVVLKDSTLTGLPPSLNRNTSDISNLITSHYSILLIILALILLSIASYYVIKTRNNKVLTPTF